jgi:hypothetical protein
VQLDSSDRAAERWRDDYRLPGTEGLELHHLYRAMAFLGEPLKAEGASAGPVRCTKDVLEEILFDRRRDLFTEVELVFFDTTTLYFEGQGGETLGQRGHNKDHRPDLPQMVVGLALDVQGNPICCELWPGNTADVTTLVPVIERMRHRFGLREITVVADRGMVSQATLETFERHEPPVGYIVGVRMRRQKEVSTEVLGHRGRWFESVPERTNPKDPAPLKFKEVWVDGRRYVVCLNEEERRKDAHDREAIVAHLRQQLRRGDKSLVGNKGYRRYLKVEGEGHFQIDEAQLKAEARYDGLWVLRTNTVYDVETVAHVYKTLWTVEQSFRTAKSILETKAHLPPERRGHSRARLLQFSGLDAQSGVRTAPEGSRLCVRMGPSASRPGGPAGGGAHLPGPPISASESVEWRSLGGLAGRRDGRAADLARSFRFGRLSRNVVPKRFGAFVTFS